MPAVAARRAVALSVAMSIALSACAEGLLFRDDELITIVRPQQDAVVRLPLTVEFALKDGAEQPAFFGIFLDTVPPGPGQVLEEEDRGEGVVMTRNTQHMFRSVIITNRDAVTVSERDRHELTVVLFDEQLRRMGESNGFVEFRIER